MTITRGICPTCSATVALGPNGRLIRHSGTQMRWSGARWFRTTCDGSGKRPVEVAPPPSPSPGVNPATGRPVDPTKIQRPEPRAR